MKPVYIPFILIVYSFLFFRCSKDEPSKSSNDNNITFTIGDKNFSLTDIEAVVREGYLDVSASKSGKEIFTISHRAGLAVGESSLTSEGALFLSIIYFPNDGGSNYGPFAQNPIGKFVITSIDEEKQIMTGAFEGVLVRYADHQDELAISGSFTFPYTIESNTPSDPFFVHKVDGKDFVGRVGIYGHAGKKLFLSLKN